MDRRKQFSQKTLSVFALMDAEGNGINSSLYKEKIKIQENENPPNAFPITPFHLCFFLFIFITNIQFPTLLLCLVIVYLIKTPNKGMQGYEE